jgi:hypothetical protein
MLAARHGAKSARLLAAVHKSRPGPHNLPSFARYGAVKLEGSSLKAELQPAPGSDHHAALGDEEGSC